MHPELNGIAVDGKHLREEHLVGGREFRLRTAATERAELQFRLRGCCRFQCDRLGPALWRVADADVVVAALRFDDEVRCRGAFALDRVGNPDEEEVAIDFLLAEELVLVVDAFRKLRCAEDDSRCAALERQLVPVQVRVFVNRPVDLECVPRVRDDILECLGDGQELVPRIGRAGHGEYANDKCLKYLGHRGVVRG